MEFSWDKVSQYWHAAWPSLAVLVITASIAFGIGMLLRYRRARIQREYQERVERQKQRRDEQA